VIGVSVVIPTYDRARLLARTLPALVSQQTEGTDYEIVFVDDGSSDGTRSLLEQAARSNPAKLRYFRLPHTGSPAGPRNYGVREARGHIIVFLDDDVLPDKDLVLCHWKYHQRQVADDYAGLGELYLGVETRRDPMSLFHTFPYHEVSHKSTLNYLYFWTCNVSLKREFLIQGVMFDEDPVLHPLEDMEFGYRLFCRGLRLEFLPEARGEHLHEIQPPSVSALGWRTGRAQSALMRKVPDVGVQKRFGIITGDLSLRMFLWRLLRRTAFRVVDNPITHAVLRALGAERGRRSRVTDLYYYLIFRRSILAGYYSAKQQSKGEVVDSGVRGEFSSVPK
jgi:glycosyltransferase involved in cell wall biosynthesis